MIRPVRDVAYEGRNGGHSGDAAGKKGDLHRLIMGQEPV